MNSSPSPHGPVRWELRSKRTLVSTRVLDLCGFLYFHPRRRVEKEFTCLVPPDWVNVVAVTREGRIVLVRQFRYGTNDFSLEVPGGVIEAGEDPVVAGVRELAEETGYGGGRARLLGSVHPNPAIQTNRCHAVLVEDVELLHSQNWDPDEEIEVSTMTEDELVAAVVAGRITHSLSLCAIMLHRERGRGQI